MRGFMHFQLNIIIQDLVELLVESNQEIPSWLDSMALESRSFGGGRRGKDRRFGGQGFGGKDFRYENGGGRGGGGSRGKKPDSLFLGRYLKG